MIDIQTKGLDRVKSALADAEKQMQFATAKALTMAGYGVRAETNRQMKAKFDRPNRYTMQGMQVQEATKEKPVVDIGLGIRIDAPSKGTPYAKALGHLFSGGGRTWKKMEGAFRRIGALPNGMQMVPGKACMLDAYGNPSRGLILQLISYFNASSEQGFRQNMTDRRRKSLAKIGKSERGYKTINGVQYFISYGRQHLPPGIWSKTGIHGSDIKPVFMFVRAGSWKRYIDLPQIGRDVVKRDFQSMFDKSLAYALRTARR